MLQVNPNTVRPRSRDWLAVLNECALHDPDNALYDYLAAMFLWNEAGAVDLSFTQRWPEGELTVTAKDKQLFEQGLRQFESGQTKKYLVLDEAARPAIAELLALSRIRRIDRAPIIWGRGAGSRIWMPQRAYFTTFGGGRFIVLNVPGKKETAHRRRPSYVRLCGFTARCRRGKKWLPH